MQSLKYGVRKVGTRIWRIGGYLGASAFPLHRNEAEKPFFIVSAGRSGTTLLRRMILETGEVSIPPETYVVGEIVRSYRRNPGLTWEEFVRMAGGIFEYNQEFQVWNLSLREPVSRLLKLPEKERSVARIIEEIYQHYALTHGQPVGRWGDKTPKYIFELYNIQRIFPEAKFLHLVRDGVDVVASILNMNREGYGLKEAAERWRRSVIRFERFRASHSERCLVIRYEDLVSDPENVFEEICSFLSLTFAPQAVASTEVPRDVARMKHHKNLNEPVTKSSVGKGREELPFEVKGELQGLIGEQLKSLGYPPADD